MGYVERKISGEIRNVAFIGHEYTGATKHKGSFYQKQRVTGGEWNEKKLMSVTVRKNWKMFLSEIHNVGTRKLKRPQPPCGCRLHLDKFFCKMKTKKLRTDAHCTSC